MNSWLSAMCDKIHKKCSILFIFRITVGGWPILVPSFRAHHRQSSVIQLRIDWCVGGFRQFKPKIAWCIIFQDRKWLFRHPKCNVRNSLINIRVTPNCSQIDESPVLDHRTKGWVKRLPSLTVRVWVLLLVKTRAGWRLHSEREVLWRVNEVRYIPEETIENAYL